MDDFETTIEEVIAYEVEIAKELQYKKVEPEDLTKKLQQIKIASHG